MPTPRSSRSGGQSPRLQHTSNVTLLDLTTWTRAHTRVGSQLLPGNLIFLEPVLSFCDLSVLGLAIESGAVTESPPRLFFFYPKISIIHVCLGLYRAESEFLHHYRKGVGRKPHPHFLSFYLNWCCIWNC